MGTPFALLLTALLSACGGAPFTAGLGGSESAPETSTPSVDMATAPVGAEPVEPMDADAPRGDEQTPETAPPTEAHDAGAQLEATAAPDGDALPDVQPHLCCIETALNPENVHCGLGATAPCSDAGYNAASCPGAVGTACSSWPESYGDPQSCASSGLCCPGIVHSCN